MAKINESQLKDMVASLQSKMVALEGKQLDELTAQDVGQGLGQVAGGVAGAAALPVRGAIAAGQAVADNAGKWWDAAKQGVQNFAKGATQGAQQGWAATDPAKLAAGGQPQQAAAKPGATKPADPKVLALQKQLIAKGATIKADGIMGPATQAAMKQFGGQAAAPAATTAPTATATAAVPGAAPATGTASLNPAQVSGGANDLWEGTSTFQQEPTLARIIHLSR